MKSALLFALASATALPLVGCSSSALSTTPPTSDAGGSDSGPSGGIVGSDTSKLVVTEQGGFVATGPTGSTCTIADATYTLTLPARDLSWKVCGSTTTSGPYAYATGAKTLTDAEYAPLASALQALAVTTKLACGADKPTEQIVVTTPSGDRTYLDNFYHCTDDGKVYIDGLDDVLSALVGLAK
ncbi:MAG TPA: hypothetical protein VGI39_06585 [Polyangiaceae bacterium]|jgi:hypothetical protein